MPGISFLLFTATGGTNSRGMADGRPKPAGEWGMLRWMSWIDIDATKRWHNIRDSWLKNEINPVVCSKTDVFPFQISDNIEIYYIFVAWIQLWVVALSLG